MAAKIIRLRFKDFKSFKKANIPLHEGFTSIAGANASGKSNIFDGLLFVMGITSLKMLRASRLTDLVHHNSSEGYAKVEIDLVNDGNEWTIARMIDRQGKSVYRINGKRRTLGEVSELLGSMKINPFGHNFVVQGDVTKIIEMNSKQRRELIDEVAGLSEFEEKKNEALKKLDTVDKRIKDTMLVLTERGNYLAELEKEKLAAEKFNALKEEMSSAKAAILSEEIKKIRAELVGAEKKRTELMHKIERLEKEKEDLNLQEKETEQKISDLTDKLISSSRETFSGIGKEVEELKAKQRFLKEKISSIESKIYSINSRISLIHEKKKQLNSSKSDLMEREKKLNSGVEELIKSFNSVSGAVDKKTSFSVPALKKINELEEKLKDFNSALNSKKELLSGAQSAVKVNENELNSLNERLIELSREKEGISVKLQEKKNYSIELDSLKKKEIPEALEKARERISSVNDLISAKKARKDSLNEELMKLSQSAGACPVCDTELKKERKEKISAKKESSIKEYEKEISALEKERQGLKEKLSGLETQFSSLNELKFKLNSFVHFEKAFDELNEKISKINSLKKEISLDELKKKENELLAAVSSLSGNAGAAEKELNELRKSTGVSDLNELMQKRNELSEKINSKKVELAGIQAELSKGIARELNSLEEEEKELKKEKENSANNLANSSKEIESNEKLLKEKEIDLEASSKANQLMEEEKQRLTVKLKNLDSKKIESEKKIDLTEKELNEFNLTQSKNEVRIVDLEQEFEAYKEMPIVKFDSIQDLKARIPQIEKEIKALGAINMRALESFGEYRKEVEEVRNKAEKLDMERKSIMDLIDKIDVKKLNIFMEFFSKVNSRFKELYYSFFEGEGKLELTDAVNPLDGGLSIQAKYEGETMKHLDAMSGGEKTLTALAFLFALQSVEPAPIYVFDEADAALDKSNSIKIGKLIKEISKGSQFISITHNDEIIKMADQIIGVALNKQKSSVIGLRLKGRIEGANMAEEIEKQEESDENEEETEGENENEEKENENKPEPAKNEKSYVSTL
ncbi:MAG: hypothetical protein ABIA76_03810 [Candidatus Diapherotrites archaeon]